MCTSLADQTAKDPYCWARWYIDGVALSNIAVKMYRSYSQRGQYHYYTSYEYEHQKAIAPCGQGQVNCGHTNEDHIVPFCVRLTPQSGAVPIIRLYHCVLNKFY